MADDTFEHRPLETPRTIRTLTLLPGSSDEVIRCEIRHVSLDHSPRYEALSYAWGDASDIRGIIVVVGGALFTLSVTASLHSALLRFRLPSDPCTLWADAVCINQRDAAEKSIQVQLMADIYRVAQCVRVWLGNDDEDAWWQFGIAAAIREHYQLLCLAVIGAFRGPEVLFQGLDPEAIIQDIEQVVHSIDWTPLFAMMECSWFTRKWIIQEVLLSCDAVIYCGIDEEFHFSWLGDLIHAFGSVPSSGLILMQRNTSMKSRATRGIMATTRLHLFNIAEKQESTISGERQGATHLVDLVLAGDQSNCSDPRDYVYSLWSLCPAIFMKPDYHLDVAGVFIQFATWALAHESRPDLLSFTTGPDPSGKLPSWVPDLTAREEGARLASPNQLIFFSAGGPCVPGSFKVGDDGRVLTCRARFLDTVDRLMYPLADLLRMEETVEQGEDIGKFVDWLQACERLASDMDTSTHEHRQLQQQSGQRFGQGMTPARFEQFWRTMICDFNATGINTRRAHASMGSDFTEYVDFNLRCVEIDSGAGSPLSEEELQRFFELNISIATSMNAFGMVGKRFCVTKSGRLGQAPRPVEAGDEICIIKGAPVPFVVRRAPGAESYQLVGEFYLHGVMDGEMLDDEGEFRELSIE